LTKHRQDHQPKQTAAAKKINKPLTSANPSVYISPIGYITEW